MIFLTKVLYFHNNGYVGILILKIAIFVLYVLNNKMVKMGKIELRKVDLKKSL